MQKHFFAVLLCNLALLQAPAHALLVNLSPLDCEEAITFGKAHKTMIEKELDTRYSFGPLNEYSDTGTIHSKWYKIALLAGYKAQRHESLTLQEQSEILNDPCLQINIIMYGPSLDFASGYQVILRQYGKEIKPDKIHADHFMLQKPAHKPPSGFPCCRAVLRSYFKYEHIDPVGLAVLVIKQDRNTLHFDINFTKFK